MQPKHTPVALDAYLARYEREWYARFWSRVRKTDTCWLWTGSKDENGYGRLGSWGGPTRLRAYRLAYEMEYGPIPAGMVMLHSCDVPACVRPSHLTFGTQADNARDRDAKGRGRIARKGMDNPLSKLTDDQVREIRRRWTGDYGQARAMCREFRIGRPSFYRIVRNQAWTHLLP